MPKRGRWSKLDLPVHRDDDGETLVIFDRQYRVRVAVGDLLRKMALSPDDVRGRLLPEILSPSEWALVREPLKATLSGRSSAFVREHEGAAYAIDVVPLIEDGKTVGGIARTRALTEERRLAAVITAQQAAARDATQLLVTAFDHAPVAMSIVDLDGHWLRVNDAYCRLLGFARDELLARNSHELVHPDDLPAYTGWALRARSGEAIELERRYIGHDTKTVWVDVRAEMITDDASGAVCVVSIVQDITDRRAADRALRASERYLRAVLDHTPEPMFAQGLDRRYQMVNRAFADSLGVSRSQILGRRDDEILAPGAAAANRVSFTRALRTGDLVQQDDVVEIDGEAREYASVKFPLRDENQEIFAICGTFSDITDRKRRETALRTRIRWTERIHDAVSQGRLVLHAQPIVDLVSGEVEQAEMLVRMRPADGSSTLILPDAFIPRAERFGLISLIDRWVLGAAIEVAVAHRVEINLSGATISDPQQVTEIERMVRASGAPPENIIFEITETAAAENMAAASAFAVRLHDLGCGFALDDFGVGFGAFTYLKNLPVDYLKIDISFVRNLLRDEASRQVVQAMVSVARDFGIKTIAEGVEDQPTLELLTLMGADYAQGYWIGRPAPLEELWPSATQVTAP